MSHEGRVVLLEGGMAEFLVSSSGDRFMRCFIAPGGHYVEYLLHTPDELHQIASSECVTLVQQDAVHVGFYEGELFLNDTFNFEGDI